MHFFCLQISGDWVLNEYITSVDGKPFPPHAPYLCPESLMKFSQAKNGKFNVSQASSNYTLLVLTNFVIIPHLVAFQKEKKKNSSN